MRHLQRLWKIYLLSEARIVADEKASFIDSIPPFLQKTIQQYKKLYQKVQVAYEQGSEQAEDLDAELEELAEYLDNALYELDQGGDELRVGNSQEKEGDMDYDMLLAQLSRLYQQYLKTTKEGLPRWANNSYLVPEEDETLDDCLARASRSTLEGYSFNFNMSKEKLQSIQNKIAKAPTQELISIAKDAYERKLSLRNKGKK